ncbi:biotinidase [Chanos chanos]|uniref:Biotinidase n=1 Tax=Chanos chanos TaxID=29144 RepID=A0A6J2WGW7_CHACN|nr:biotinidase-like [Chanos chanos]XP_030644765.1 biotinidase-like [Chanos chanos]XP_030644766.1 biotinidase-like [Chanos chanos]
MAVFILTTAFVALFLSEGLVVKAEVPSYIAAVYEHHVILNPEPHVPIEREAALVHMNKNLDVFEEQAASAAKQGAQIIVFPENGLHGFKFTRTSIVGYLETVPDPSVVTWNPCTEPDRFPNTEVLQRLSCMAQKNHLFLVANMPNRQNCDNLTDPHCPPDGRYQFNTNIVFSDNGTLIARYNKLNLYFEKEYDTPPECEHVTFTTPFAGKFGIFTCFDILFYEPVLTQVKMGVRQFVFPTAWMNKLPLLAGIHFQRSFSYATGITLLAANTQAKELGMTGSGIYTPWHAVYHHDKEAKSGKLLVSKVPVLDPSMMEDGEESSKLKLVPFSGHSKHRSTAASQFDVQEQQKHMSERCLSGDMQCRERLLSEPPTFISNMMNDNFTFVPLQGVEGNLKVCDGSLCCHLWFRRSGPEEELYALGAFRGIHAPRGTYYLEVCALVRCTGTEFRSCGGGIENAQTVVDFRLQGTFSTPHIYPGVLGSEMTLDRPDESGWENKSEFYMTRKGMATGLVTAVLYGRVYEKDGYGKRCP